MYIMMLHLTLLLVSILKGTSSSYQTKAVPPRIKLATFIYSCFGAKEFLIWFYVVFLWFDSLMQVLCGSKHLGTLSLILVKVKR